MTMKDLKAQQTAKILELARTDRSVDAPEFARKYARNLFVSRATQPAPSMIRRIIATLTAELAPGELAFGERSAAASQERQLLFQADEIAIDVRVSKSSDGVSIRGIVLGTAGTPVEAVLTGKVERRTPIDELGMFAFESVAHGEVEVAIVFADREIGSGKFTI